MILSPKSNHPYRVHRRYNDFQHLHRNPIFRHLKSLEER